MNRTTDTTGTDDVVEVLRQCLAEGLSIDIESVGTFRADAQGHIRFLAARGLLARRGDALVKRPNTHFQVTHLLAFLLRDEATLTAQRHTLETPSPEASEHNPHPTNADALEGLEHLDTLALDVGDGLDSDAATRLAELSERRRLPVLIRGSARRETAQYERLDEELPPSMLWVRIAIRASQASRGEQRLATQPSTAS